MRNFTPKQLKELREINPRVTDGLFNKIVEDLNDDYSFMTDPDSIEFNAAAFEVIKRAREAIKVVNAIHLLTNLHRVYVDEVTKKIAFAFWL